ncbi:MAG TPA: pantetheine-phosphate adenylyltransferase [Candidatus Nanoarchaeia archaeon]|nr:pantetheine-phosphate adenylyltransferase [Candidatus Nanoarchaeia archaeon]
MRIAVCPGSFDPITNGHVDVIERALRLFDKVIIVVGENPQKKELFSADERVSMIREVFRKYNSKVEVEHFEGLLLDYLKRKKVNIIVRGLRALSDFEYEFQRALMNRELSPDIETVFVMTKDDYAFVSSSILKEVAMLGGDVGKFVPLIVGKRLKEKFKQGK